MPDDSLAPQPGERISAVRKSSNRGFRYYQQDGAKLLTFLCALISVLTTLGIIYELLTQALPFFQKVSLVQFFTGTEWRPTSEPGAFGVLPLITGTLLITVGAGIIALPLGVLNAIFLSEYAPPKLRKILKPALELLAGIPTVVYGYLGLFLVTPLLRRLFPDIQAANAASGAIVVGIMILPLVSSLCEDAIRAVPRSMREGAYGLGATKAEVTLHVVTPAALSGIMASFILALSRALGETMAVALAAGSNPILTLNPTKSIQTMTAYIVQMTSGDVATGTTAYNSIFAVGVTLFAMTFLMNYLAMRLVSRFRQVYA
jgi:phosphate transport system permease protein